MTSLCPGCGVAVSGDARNCKNCGWDFQSAPKGFSLPAARSIPAEIQPPEAVAPEPVKDVVKDPSPATPAPRSAPEAAPARFSGLYLALFACSGLILAGLAAILLLMRKDGAAVGGPTTGTIAFERHSRADVTPIATSPPVVSPRAEPPAAAGQAARPEVLRTGGPARKERTWVFEGVVYDLLSARGVYGARLRFSDGKNTVGAAESGPEGRYRVALPAGSAPGYSLQIAHEDYAGRHIDEMDSTSSLRKADYEQRRFLVRTAVRNVPWIGALERPARRDIALIPKSAEEP
ncbi:MAG: hypothetical protein HYZ74_06745 [Elusimicrobia bacterium]|nr:hypothetical protein [Elusimicrobiota bacterium]